MIKGLVRKIMLLLCVLTQNVIKCGLVFICRIHKQYCVDHVGLLFEFWLIII